MDYNQKALELHEKYGGKITTKLRDQNPIDKEALSSYYSPGVGAVSKAIAADPTTLPKYTWTNNLVAVISDGSAILGLGNLGPKAAMPVMEGKALLFKHFAGIDSVPIILDVHNPDEIVATVKAMADSFGAINLEDIAAPQCFEIEERLKEECDVPVFHDDQHGTAVVTLAGLINSMKVTGKNFSDLKIVITGAGAAGVAIAKILRDYGQKLSHENDGKMPNILAIDSKGIIADCRTDLNESKQRLLDFTNPEGVTGLLDDAIENADVFIGVSQPGVLTPEHIKKMAKDPVVFALANPVPEIMPEEALAAGVAVIATGRSDYPNQVNNAIAFPGIFKGALTNGVKQITDDHKMAAAEAIAGLIEDPTADTIIPSVLDERLVLTVAAVIK